MYGIAALVVFAIAIGLVVIGYFIHTHRDEYTSAKTEKGCNSIRSTKVGDPCGVWQKDFCRRGKVTAPKPDERACEAKGDAVPLILFSTGGAALLASLILLVVPRGNAQAPALAPDTP